MNFDLSPDQSMLRDTLTRLLADWYPFETRRAVAKTPRGWSAELWEKLAELGVLAATFSEDDGGLGAGAEGTLVIGEALGAVLSAEPYLPTVVMAGAALTLCEDVALRRRTLAAIVSGETVIACDLETAGVSAQGSGEGFRLNGTMGNLTCGGVAESFILTARGEAGPVVVLIDARTNGLNLRAHRTFDGVDAASLSLINVEPEAVLARGAAADAMTARVRERAIAYLAAEAVGLMSATLDLTTEHLRTRRQFGQALGKFQALQHRAAEMLIALEQARSMAIYAAMMDGESDSLTRELAYAAIKAVIADAARFVGQNAVQLHGGIGLTDEHFVGWALRRLTMIELLFGDADAQSARLAELGGLVEDA
jgi:alkylation response protein AidB-like acyl-CoA dehydrogenase